MGFPQVESVTETQMAADTSHDVDMPVAVDAGDLLIILISVSDDDPGTNTMTTPAGWTELYKSEAPADDFVIVAAYVKVAAGTEGGTSVDVVTSDSQAGSSQVYRISNWFGALAGVESAESAAAQGANPDPPSLNPGAWGIEDTLWLTVVHGGDDDATVLAYPTDYTNGVDTVSGAGGNAGCEVGSARRENAIETEDPGTFTLSETERTIAVTIAIRTVAAVVPVQTTISPTGYAIVLKDNNGNIVDHIQNKVEAVSWEWDRIGGCGLCRLVINTEWESKLSDQFNNEDYEINIYLPTVSGTAELWYAGFVDRVAPSLQGNRELISVSCLGYVNQLKRAIVREKTYSNQEIGSIAQNVAEVYATGITSITTTADDFEDTQFSADSVYFNETVYDAIKKLAGIAGRREWGVRADKSLFFLTRDDRIKEYYYIPEDFSSFRPQTDFNPIITRIYLEGSSDYKDVFEVTNKITIREQIVSNSAITTRQVGSQFARAYLKEHGVPRRSYTGTLIERNRRIESIIPIGQAAVTPGMNIKYLYDVATQLYDSDLKYDGGLEAFQIEKIRYTLTDTGVTIGLSFGPIPPNLVDDLARLEFLIDTERIKL